MSVAGVNRRVHRRAAYGAAAAYGVGSYYGASGYPGYSYSSYGYPASGYGSYYASGYPGYGYGGYSRPGYRAARRVAIHRARWHWGDSLKLRRRCALHPSYSADLSAISKPAEISKREAGPQSQAAALAVRSIQDKCRKNLVTNFPGRSVFDWNRRLPMKILPHLQPRRGNSVHHCAISEHGQIEAVSVEGDELRTQFADLFDKVAYQLGFGSLADMWCAERVYAPALGLPRRD
jgi:hypothetical protein